MTHHSQIDAGPLRSLSPRPWRELEAVWSLAGGSLRRRERRGLVRGEANVTVIPGFLTGDSATWMLRRRLRRLGHRVRGWGLGLNRGNVEALVPALVERTARDAQRMGEPLHLVGWSLGGFLAREVARETPKSVAQVITLASPIVGGPKYTSAAHRYRQRGVDLDAIERQVAERDQTHPLRRPVTAIWSRRDSVVCPASCIDRVNDHVRHVEVDCAHASFAFDDAVLAIVAQTLASPLEPELTPFERDR
ncbi:MAG: hypothetical protein AAF411_14550 [Myxococcota bacterium]